VDRTEEGADVSRCVKVLILLALAIGMAVAVSKMFEMQQQFMAMTEEEQREFIASKLGDKVPEDKLAEIQDGIVSAVRSKKGGDVSTA
jgi:hypothetical protein